MDISEIDLTDTDLVRNGFPHDIFTTLRREEPVKWHPVADDFTENDDTGYQTGQELHLDVVLNQFFSDTFAIGIHGFYLKQITGDSGGGALLGDFKAEAAGVGPALLWTTKIGNQDVSFIAKWLHEFHAENRLEGDHIFFGFAVDW